MATEKISRKIKMDFKSLLSKLDSMEAPASTPAAPTLDKAVQLNEDAQLRVLAGQTTYVAEAKKKKDEEVKEEMKVGDKKPSSTGGTIEKTATGVKHSAGKNYGGDKAPKDDEDDEPKAKKAKKESIEPEFKSKFMKMVEAKKEESEAEAKKKKEDKKKKMAKIMDEGAKPDFLDLDKDGDKKEPMKSATGDKKDGKKDGKKGMSAAQEKFFGKKKTVKESFENVLSFRDMIKLVQESGGQQAIDPIDTTLFAWAQRVAASKYTESAKAEVFAGMLYERNGGRFEMYDVLSED
jgi:hypothetical protein